MKILKMIFHIAVMAAVILLMGYLMGLHIKEQEPVERKLGRKQNVVYFEGDSKAVTDQYIEKYLMPIDERINTDSIVYYDEEEILYNGAGYELGNNGAFYAFLSCMNVHNLKRLVEAYPDPILRDCGNGYYYAMYHTDNDNRLYVFMISEESNHNQYMDTIGYPIVMTDKLQYSDFQDIKKNDKIDCVAQVDPATRLYQNMGKQMPLTTVHLLTDGLLRIKYRVRYGVYLVDEIIFDEDFLGQYKIYEQDYVPEKTRYRRGISYDILYDMDLENGFRTTSTSYSASFLADGVEIQLNKYTGKQSQANTSEMESVTVGGSTYFYDENCYFYDGDDGSGKTYMKRVLAKRGAHDYVVTASSSNEERLQSITIDKLVDITYLNDKWIDGYEKCDESWTKYFDNGVVSGYVRIVAPSFMAKEYEWVKNNESFRLCNQMGTRFYLSDNIENNHNYKVLYYKSREGLITIVARMRADRSCYSPKKELEFVNIDLAKRIIRHITR